MPNFFQHIYQFFLKRTWTFRIGLFLLLLALALGASKISFEEDISKLIPTTSQNETFQKVLKNTNFSDKLIVHIRSTSEGTTETLTEIATAFLDSLAPFKEDYIKDIQGQVAEEAALETFDFVFENLPIFLSESDYSRIEQRLKPDSILAVTKANYNTLISPSGIIAKKTIVRDPLGLSFLALNNLKDVGVDDDFKIADGFVVSNEGTDLLLFITPKFETSETAKNEEFAEILYRVQEDLSNQFDAKIQLNYFGGNLIAVANAQQIKQDIQFTVGIALTVLLIFLIFFYRKLYIPILLLLPTLFGALLAIVFLYALRGEISAISLGIGAVLLGVTLDYSLHILTHIRNHGVKNLFAEISKPILMSGMTTALAFLCLLFIDSQALQDLGIFAAVSVMGTSVSALVIIPQLYKGGVEKQKKNTFLDTLASYPFHKNKVFIGCVAALAIVSVFTFQKVSFNKDLSKLNYVPEHLTNSEKKLDGLLNTKSKSVYVVAYGSNLQEALTENDAIFQKLKTLEKDSVILGFNSIAGLVNSATFQQEKLKRWGGFWSAVRVDTLLSNLISSGKDYGFKPKAYLPLSELLTKDFKSIPFSEFSALESFPVSDFISEKEEITTVTNLVKVSDKNAERINKVFSTSENTVVIDRQGLNESLLGNLKDDFNNLILYCSLVVAILLLLFYRNWKITLVTLLPILLTWWITLGLMGLFGLQFNIFNVIVSSFVFGLGVDYCIFITNGLLEGKPQNLATYKTSILLSVLTTLLGMGVLIFAKHPALYSISMVSLIGIFSAAVISFTLQPVLYRLLIFKEENIK